MRSRRRSPVELRRYARRQTGCRALMSLYGIGELTAVAILAELGDARRFSSSRHAVRYAGLDITVHQSDQRRAPGHLSRQGPPALRWALYEAAQAARRPGALTAPTTTRPPSASAATAPASRSHANCSSAASTPCASSATRPSSPPDQSRCAPSPPSPRCTAARSPHAAAATLGWTASKDRAAATRPPRHPINHHVTDPRRGSRTEISPGARAHHSCPDHHAHGPPTHNAEHHTTSAP